MQQPPFDYSRTYADMSDAELLAIARDSASLTEEALAALRKQIEERHLEKGSQADDEEAVADYRFDWRARLESKLNSPQMILLLPRWQSAAADRDLQILLGQQVIAGWLAVIASQFILGGLLSLWIIIKLMPLHASSHLGKVFTLWMPIVVALDVLCIFAGLALWNKWPSAVRLAKVAFAVSVLNSIIFVAVLTLIGFISRPATSALSGSFGPLLAPDIYSLLRQMAPFYCFGIVYGVAGFLYMAKSRRVRLTYP